MDISDSILLKKNAILFYVFYVNVIMIFSFISIYVIKLFQFNKSVSKKDKYISKSLFGRYLLK